MERSGENRYNSTLVSGRVGHLLANYSSGGVPPYIYGDIGGVDRWVWFVLANLLALAAVCPFVGAMSDLWGRRYVALGGASFIILGMIVCSTAHTMNTFIGTFFIQMMSLLRLVCISLMISRWNGYSRHRCRGQRVDGFGCNCRAGTDCEEREIRGSFDLHHPSFLSLRPLESIDCIPFKLEIHRSSMRCLGNYRPSHDGSLLLSTTQNKLVRFE